MSQSSSHSPVSLIESPPTSLLGTLARLGPGLIIAGSIVGSGELIGTTSTGGKAGFVLLWLILIGCVIKVFTQVEFGRFSIVTGQTTMAGLNEIPGPRLGRLGNWLIWYWFVMFLSSLGQLGGIVGGVGQAMAISMPLTQAGRDFNLLMERKTQVEVKRAELRLRRQDPAKNETDIARLEGELASLDAVIREAAQANSDYAACLELWRAEQALPSQKPTQEERNADVKALETAKDKMNEIGKRSRDAQLWAGLLTVITAVLLVAGRYRFIETASTIFVAGFTFVTVINVVMLQMHPTWHMSWSDLASGLSFRLPEKPSSGTSAVAMALATFGIIGVGTNELLAYPYFCIEKGYARYAGKRDAQPGWAERARGWMRVMRVDAWCSMVVYTFATVAFYILGASILFPIGLDAKGPEMIRTLAVMYEPIFGPAAPALFLVGAFAVLYSTFFVANAGHARVCADVLQVLHSGWAKLSPAASQPAAAIASAAPELAPEEREKRFVRLVRIVSGILPFVCLAIYLFYAEPRALVLFSGFMQALMLPMLAGSALYFRYVRCDERVQPGRLWDFFLWLSAVGLLIAAAWAIYANGEDAYKWWISLPAAK